MKSTIEEIISPDFYIKSVCMGMTLHGDPALKMNSHEKPDLVLRDEDISFDPAVVSNAIDSFDVVVVLSNFGRGFDSDFTLELKRYLPTSNQPEIYTKTLKSVAYKDTIRFRMAVDIIRAAGLNRFEATADVFGFVDEIVETNNFGVAQLNIGSSDIAPVVPYEYAIVPSPPTTLKAVTSDLFAPEKTYVIEVDTIDDFNSPFKYSGSVTQIGGVVEFNVPFSIDSNVVYFWRVGRDSVLTDTVNYVWRESSFIYIPGKSGWSQAHFHQFKHSDLNNVIYNKSDNQFEYVTTQAVLNCKNAKNPFVASVEYSINNLLQDYGACQLVPSMHVAVIDSIDIENPWETADYFNVFGHVNQYNPVTGVGTCRQRSEKYFIFRTNTQAQLDELKNFIAAVPNGNYVLAWSVFGGRFSDWSANGLNTDFVNMGSTLINTIEDDQPFIFFARKGDPGSAVEIAGDSLNPNPELTVFLGGNWKSGFVTSTIVGPAKSWSTLKWDQFAVEGNNNTQDSISLDLIGIASNNSEVVLIDDLSFNTPEINNLDQFVDASMYPYVKLRAYVEDDSLRSPPQLDKWQLYYEPVPEAALNPAKHFEFTSGALEEGQEVRMEIAVENISQLDMDSMLVDFFVFDKDNVRTDVSSPRYKALAAGDTLIASVSFTTKGFAGENSFWIEANPNKDQPEQYHPNNIAEYRFDVSADITNPILDVTFDGIHILDGDIVSAKPIIVVQLHDENKYLALNDTSKFRLFLRHPDGENQRLRFEQAEGINTGTGLLGWEKAELPRNSFKMFFNPELLLDGQYTLDVEASDESGNLSGANNYTITFEVINRSTITEVINYPNPFSTSTRFVFTLTGSEIPDYFKIQIMTVSGKIVREITTGELGSLHVGRNITDYAWDGRDEFGDRLANGVYLYRVISHINGEKIELRETAASQYFKKGYGKMVILR